MKIQDYLLQQSKATWTEISEATNIQPKELSSDLKKLLDKKVLLTEQDRTDRRKTWYWLKDRNKALAESKRFEAIDSISSLGAHEVSFAQSEAQDRGLRAKASVFSDDLTIPKAEIQGVADKAAKSFLKGLHQLDMQDLKSSSKYTFLLTVEIGGEKAE